MGESSASGRCLLRVAALGASALVCGVVAELALRLLGISYPAFVEPDEVAGTRLRPFVAGWFTEEGRGHVVANALGFRDRAHPLQKPPGTYRIAFLGDSYTEARQVALEDAWWMRVEAALRGCESLAGRAPEAMSFALAGIGTAQQFEIDRRLASRYQADLVVLAFVPNDVMNNHPAFGGANSKPFYRLDASGQLVLDDSFKDSAEFAERASLSARGLRRAADYSRVVQLLLEGRRALRRREAAAESPRVAENLSAPPSAHEWVEAWQWTEALLVALARRTAERGSEFLLVAVSSPHQVHPSLEHRRRRLGDPERGQDPFYWNRRLAALAAREGIAFLSLSEPFAEYASREQVCLHGFPNMLPCDGHWNLEGHRLAAEHVSAAICAKQARAPDHGETR